MTKAVYGLTAAPALTGKAKCQSVVQPPVTPAKRPVPLVTVKVATVSLRDDSMGRWHARCVLNGRGGRYHFTARGNELGIFRDEAEHFLFLGLLSQLGEYFGVRVHAYVLMGNHYR